jgi:hypothetical protein
VSVDTYLKKKRLDRYSVVEHEGVRILVSPRLEAWAEEVFVDAKRSLFGRSFDVEALHAHGPACSH